MNLRFIFSIFFSLVITILSVFFLDQPVATWIQNAPYPQIKYWAREITNIGLATFYIASSIILYVFSKWVFPKLNYFENKKILIEKMRIWSGFTFSAFAFNGIIVQILKGIIGRQRPHLTDTFETLNFAPMNLHWHWHSMPSGHTQVMFTAATVLALAFPKFRWGFFILALVIASTRVILHQHFLSDFILGSSIGIIGTLWISIKIRLLSNAEVHKAFS